MPLSACGKIYTIVSEKMKRDVIRLYHIVRISYDDELLSNTFFVDCCYDNEVIHHILKFNTQYERDDELNKLINAFDQFQLKMDEDYIKIEKDINKYETQQKELLDRFNELSKK